VLFAGLINVGELLLATDTLHAGGSGYALLVAAWGLGIAAGSLAGSRGGRPEELGRRYLAGLGLTGAAFLACGVAPAFIPALLAFAAGGVGNGLVIVHERLLFQALVPGRLLGRVYSLKDTLQSWAFAPGFAGAGLLASLLGPRALFLIAGAGALGVWGLASVALRRAWAATPANALSQPSPLAAPVLEPA
jgi:MFS family permease